MLKFLITLLAGVLPAQRSTELHTQLPETNVYQNDSAYVSFAYQIPHLFMATKEINEQGEMGFYMFLAPHWQEYVDQGEQDMYIIYENNQTGEAWIFHEVFDTKENEFILESFFRKTRAIAPPNNTQVP